MKRLAALPFAALLVLAPPLAAQDLGPQVRKVRDGIYVYAAKAQDSNVSIILTKEGVVMIDTGQTPVDSLAAMGVLKKLSAQPVRFVIHTEPHDDHTNGDFVFSPPAVVVAHAGAAESMRKANTVERNQKLAGEYPGMGEAMKGYRQVLPHIEFQQKMTLNLGERTLELIYLKNVHSEADTAVWLPRERVLWAAAAVGVKRYPNIRPFLTVPDILASIKSMRALNPEIVIAGHGAPGTTQIFDEMERYYGLLLERVGRMAREGRTLDQIKAEIRMPEFDDWAGKDRFPNNVEAAWRAVKGS
ncbi:MAG TPA: MBL fold metallo-hydrolase [Burkholderiales bacterium]|nr:MBL fold metallo-hydrolase [Burkholderiales bacterium]